MTLDVKCLIRVLAKVTGHIVITLTGNLVLATDDMRQILVVDALTLKEECSITIAASDCGVTVMLTVLIILILLHFDLF